MMTETTSSSCKNDTSELGSLLLQAAAAEKAVEDRRIDCQNASYVVDILEMIKGRLNASSAGTGNFKELKHEISALPFDDCPPESEDIARLREIRDWILKRLAGTATHEVIPECRDRVAIELSRAELTNQHAEDKRHRAISHADPLVNAREQVGKKLDPLLRPADRKDAKIWRESLLNAYPKAPTALREKINSICHSVLHGPLVRVISVTNRLGHDGATDLLDWAETKLVGIEQRVVTRVVEGGGRIKLADLAADPSIDWPASDNTCWYAARKRLNPKLKRVGYKLITDKGHARLSRLGQKSD